MDIFYPKGEKLSFFEPPSLFHVVIGRPLLISTYLGMWYPDTWISGYLDIQAFLAIHYPDTKKVEISTYPSIQVPMISGYQKNVGSTHPYTYQSNITALESPDI